MTHPKHAAADHEVLAIIRERWSPRAFDTTRPLPLDDLWRLFEAARWAPSSRNEQPWRFVVTHREHSPEAYLLLLSSLGANNQSWAISAPALILTAVQLVLEQTGLDQYPLPNQLLEVFQRMQDFQLKCAADPNRQGYRHHPYKDPATRLRIQAERGPRVGNPVKVPSESRETPAGR